MNLVLRSFYEQVNRRRDAVRGLAVWRATGDPGAGCQQKTLEERVKDLERRLAELEERAAAEDAKRVIEDGEGLLKKMQDCARIQYSKTGTAPEKLTGRDGCGLKAEELKSKDYAVADKVYYIDAGKAALLLEPVDPKNRFATIVFDWRRGQGEVSWYDTLDALKKAHADVEWVAKEPDPNAPDPAKQWDELYKVGASWVVKMDFGMSMWTKTEVVKVKDGVATVKSSTKMKEADPWPDAYESTMERPTRAERPAPRDPKYKEIATGSEKVKDWDTTWLEYEYDGIKGKIWTSTKYGSIVKMSDKDGKVTLELIELNAK